MALIIIREFNSVNIGLSVGGKAWRDTASRLQDRFGRLPGGVDSKLRFRVVAIP